MSFKKIFIAAIVFSLFSAAIVVAAPDGFKISEFRYQCRVESHNPLWHILFFLFSADNREFLWREKNGFDGKGDYREISLFNKSREVARFFSGSGICRGKVDFGAKDMTGELTAEQAGAWFEIGDFILSARPGEEFRVPYRTAENSFFITIRAREKVFLETAGGGTTAVYFEGKVVKTTAGASEEFLDIKFWMADAGALQGRVVRCLFKKSFWPPVILEIK